MFDLIIRKANLPDGRTGIDIAVGGGKDRRRRTPDRRSCARRKSMRRAGW